MNFVKYITIFSIIFLFLQILSICFPIHFNWGVHFLAFHDEIFIVIYILITIALLFESFRKKVYEFLVNIINKFKKSKYFPYLTTIFIFTIIVLIFPVKTHLLGDGALLLREISNVWLADDIPPAFSHQFLIGISINIIKNMIHTSSIEEAEIFYRYYDYIAGIILISLIFFLMKQLQIKPVEKFLLGAFILSSAGIQLFIGYVENYGLLYVSINALIITGWLSLENKLNVLIPLVIFLFAIGFHISSLVLLPAILYLLYQKSKDKKLLIWIGVGIIFIISLFIFIFYKEQFLSALNQAIQESRWSLLPLFSIDNYYSYTIFSYIHIIDWLNANLLLAPFGLAIVFGAVLFYKNIITLKDKILVFLIFSTIFALLFTFITHFALGMARDWDFIASFFIPILYLNIYLFMRISENNNLNHIIILVLGLTILNTFSWIMINADEKKAINRIRVLNDVRFLGRIPRMNYYENLGSYYYWKNDFVQAKNYFEEYVKVDSTNPRILGNLAAIYTKLNEREKLFQTLQKAANANSPNPGIYINLGVEYSKMGDTSTALKYYLKALQLDSTRSKAYANIGSLFMNQKRYDLAKENYIRALKWGLKDPIIYRELGYASYYLKEYNNALSYFEIYLMHNPADTNAKFMKENLELLLEYLKNNNNK